MKLSILWLIPVLVMTWGSSKAQNAASYKIHRALVEKYLVKSKELYNFFHIDEKGIVTYASLEDKRNNKPECVIYWDEVKYFTNLLLHTERKIQLSYYLDKKATRFTEKQRSYLQNIAYTPTIPSVVPAPGKLLSGYRIAIDPGHIAGDMEMAKTESRFIELEAGHGRRITFCEGDLTLTTAFLLKRKLEEHGAMVMMTRSSPNTTSSGKTYKQWLRDDLPAILLREEKAGRLTAEQRKALLQTPQSCKIYTQYFLANDLLERAHLINSFKPDITVVIHFNADPEKKHLNQPTKKNYSMVFIPGAFLKGELNTPEGRLDFLRLLLLDNMNKSQKLSEMIQNEFVTRLKVPAIPPDNQLAYLKNYSTYVSRGVYARNLGLCRLINSPICYGESMYQDNEKEMFLLGTNDLQNNKPSPRIVEVADAYFAGIIKYFENLKQGK